MFVINGLIDVVRLISKTNLPLFGRYRSYFCFTTILSMVLEHGTAQNHQHSQQPIDSCARAATEKTVLCVLQQNTQTKETVTNGEEIFINISPT